MHAMALPSLATRPPAGAERTRGAGRFRKRRSRAAAAAAGLIARVKAILAERSDSRLAQLIAGKVFLVRVGSALLALASQVLLARWMGSFEFGIYIYVWTWVLMIGALSDFGLSSAARRFIPEYTELKSTRPPARIPIRQPLARVRRRHRDRSGRRHRRDRDRALARPLRGDAALSRLRHHPDLRPGAGAGRHRAIL